MVSINREIKVFDRLVNDFHVLTSTQDMMGNRCKIFSGCVERLYNSNIFLGPTKTIASDFLSWDYLASDGNIEALLPFCPLVDDYYGQLTDPCVVIKFFSLTAKHDRKHDMVCMYPPPLPSVGTSD